MTGKTAFSNQFLPHKDVHKFPIQYKPTVCPDFLTTEFHSVTIQLWDTAGERRFGVAFYRGADGLILMFDLTNRTSFLHIPEWMKTFLVNAGLVCENFPVIVLGNKSDCKERAVSKEEIANWVKMQDNPPVMCIMINKNLQTIFMRQTERLSHENCL